MLIIERDKHIPYTLQPDGRYEQTRDHGARVAFVDHDEYTEDELQRLEQLEAKWSISPGDCVLEPGCGSGRLTERLVAAVGPEGVVIACDTSSTMVERARARVSAPSLSVVCRDVAAMHDFCEEVFDHAICLDVFPLFPHPETVLQTLRSLLKPGGRLWIHQMEDHEHDGRPMPERDDLIALLALTGFLVDDIRIDGDGYALDAWRI